MKLGCYALQIAAMHGFFHRAQLFQVKVGHRVPSPVFFCSFLICFIASIADMKFNDRGRNEL